MTETKLNVISVNKDLGYEHCVIGKKAKQQRQIKYRSSALITTFLSKLTSSVQVCKNTHYLHYVALFNPV